MSAESDKRDLHIKIQEYAQGTCKSESEIANDLDTDEDTVLEAMAGSDIMRCSSCEWWCEQCEMEEVDGSDVCEDCRG